MTKENLSLPELLTFNDELIIKLLDKPMSVKEMIARLNNVCDKKTFNRINHLSLTKRLLSLRAEGKIEYLQTIYSKSGKVIDSIWRANPLN